VASPFELGGVRWWPAAAADASAVRLAVGRALEVLASGGAANEKAGRRKELYRLALLRPGEPDHLLKVNHYPALVGLRRRLLASKSRRELALAEALARRGIATPVPLAAGERRAGGRVRSCYLLVPFVRGARDLRQAAADPALAPAERRRLAAAFGAFARRLHDAGVWQGDFQPNNFLLGPGGPADLLAIDYERVRLRRSLSPQARAAMLAKLERELPAARLAERARFLRAYAGGDPGEARRAWHDVGSAVRALAGRDAARLARTAAPRGRRYAPVAAGGWRGLRVVEVEPEPLARALADLLARDPRAQASGFTLHAGDAPFFALGFAASHAGARRGLARALVLARRGGLAPRPVALVERAGRALLVFEGSLPPRLDGADPTARRAALPALLRLFLRLAALGSLAEPPALALLGRASSGGPERLVLLAPVLLAPGGRGRLPDRRAARALALRALALPEA
jgi:hypothetical protein